MSNKGRTVLVTGAAGGLGRAIAARFATDGARLILTDREGTGLEAVAARLDAEALCIAADLADEASLDSLARAVADHTDTLDVLINNAGIAHGKIATGFFGLGQETWQRFMAVNTLAPLLLAERLHAQLAVAQGLVINISSMAAFVPGTAYGVTKAALNAVTFGLANQLAGEGIRCIGVAPGMMETEVNRETLGEDVLARMKGLQLAPARAGMPQDIANFCAFAASDEGGFLNNETYPVDAGNRVRGWRS